MARGYIRIGDTVYMNMTSEEDRDKLIKILSDRKYDFRYEQEKYYFDDVEYEWKYSWSFSFKCTPLDLIDVLNEFNGEVEEE